jgi:hypothetical protein
MTDEPDNLVLKKLALLRDDVAALGRHMGEKIDALDHKVGALAQTLVGVQRDIHGLKRDVRSLDDRVATLGVAVDEHTHRLDRIEKRLGLVEAE